MLRRLIRPLRRAVPPPIRRGLRRIVLGPGEPRPADALAALLGAQGEGFDYARLAQLTASLEAARYYARHFQQARAFPNYRGLLRFAVEQRAFDGLVLEFGVGGGKTINLLADQLAQTVHGFDSFEGLPQQWRPEYPKGAFAQSPPPVRSSVELHIGDFADSLPPFLEEHGEPVSLLHIDCDLYGSTRTVLELLADRLRPGTVIVFDEYINYPGWRRGEFRAFREFVRSNAAPYEYIGFVPSHQQVAIRLT